MNILFIILFLLIELIFLTSCGTQEKITIDKENPIEKTIITDEPGNNIDNVPEIKINENNSIKTNKKGNSFTIEEVSIHNLKSDCWIIIDNEVYNITPYINDHPLIKRMVNGCGKDPSDGFEKKSTIFGNINPKNMKNKIKDFYIGNLTN